MNRLPFAPLRDAAILAVEPDDHGRRYDGPRTLAPLLHSTERVVQRWRRAGLDVFEADHAATALGRHPSAIWPEWYDVAPDVDDTESCCTCRLGDKNCLPCVYGVCAYADRPDSCGCQPDSASNEQVRRLRALEASAL